MANNASLTCDTLATHHPDFAGGGVGLSELARSCSSLRVLLAVPSCFEVCCAW